MKLLFLCGREVSYPFNQYMLNAFRQFSQVEVIDEYSEGRSISKRSLNVALQGLNSLIKSKYDRIYIGFYGQLLMLPFGLLSRKPIIFNPFLSTFDTLVFDRQRYSENSLVARMAFWLDKLSCKLASTLVLDTKVHANFFSRTFEIPERKFNVIYVGCDENLFFPRPIPIHPGIIVHFHGSFLPLHGVDMIIRAAEQVNNNPVIRFQLQGQGIAFTNIRKMAADARLTNIDFIPEVPLRDLPNNIAQADICLAGLFGTSEKARRVIAGKTFRNLAMGKATIVSDNPANREILTPGYDAWFCEANHPDSLAASILRLAQDQELRTQLGQNARETFLRTASLQAQLPKIKQIVENPIS
jgi:glycosyltransferase involved in cell wall biosynthesis